MPRNTDVMKSPQEPPYLTENQAAQYAALKEAERRRADVVVKWFGEKYDLPDDELQEIRGALGLL